MFRERFLTCFIADPIGIKLRHDIGIDNISWECDYPHSDSSWPAAAEELAVVMDGLPDDEINKITYENACRWYSFDPFAHRTREQCTVGALRAEAGGPRRRGPELRPGQVRAQDRRITGLDRGGEAQCLSALSG